MHIKTTALRPILSGDYRKFLTASHQGIKQKIVIDFSSPNIAKPFHFGHLKSTILGNYLANLHEFLGHEVVRVNYIGDWGTQYGILSLGLEKFKYDLASAKSANQRLRELLDIYVKANELARSDETFYAAARHRFKQLDEENNSEHYRIWRDVRNTSLEELKRSYSSLGIAFDHFEYESDHARDIDFVIRLLEKNCITRRSADGMLSATVLRYGKTFEVPVLKADGTSLYITRDIAAVIRRKDKYKFDKMLYVVGADQEKHFYCLSDIIKNLGYDWYDQMVHVKTGKVLGMSSRQGTSILLSDIIDEATKQYIETTKQIPTSKVTDQVELGDVGKNLALSALFVYDMRNKRTKSYNFAWEKVMNVTDRSGIHLQTTYARLCSLIRKNQELGVEPLKCADKLSPDALSCIEACNLLDQIDKLPSIIDLSYNSMNPAELVNHTFTLCKAINRARQSENLWVIGESNKDYAQTRLTLFKAAQIQLELILRLLGLKPLTRV